MTNHSEGASWVVLKFGGGLITDKQTLLTPRTAVIEALAGAVANIKQQGKQVIIVHGAGSFGHLKAKRWRLHEGRLDGWTPETDQMDGLETQDQACESVHQDMLSLNSQVVQALTAVGLESSVHPPRDWARGIGPSFSGEFQHFLEGGGDVIPVFFGDVVHCGDGDFGILSGDDVILRLAVETKGVKAVVFCVGGAAGLMSAPPEDSTAELVPVWSKGMQLHGFHDRDIDVTGGIALKAARATEIAEVVEHVWLVDGRYPDRVVEAALGGGPIGTRIIA